MRESSSSDPDVNYVVIPLLPGLESNLHLLVEVDVVHGDRDTTRTFARPTDCAIFVGNYCS